MTDQPYTTTGDVRAERSLGALVERITDATGRVPGLDAVLLGGSVGRGEATVRMSAHGPVIESDLEVYLVGRSRALRHAARSLTRQLTKAHSVEVSVAWLDPRRLKLGRAKNLSRQPSQTIQLYELATGTRVIHGAAPAIASVNPARLPLAEGVRLILNRFAEGSRHLTAETSESGRWMDKILIACADTMLLAGGQYTVRYQERAERVAGAMTDWPMPEGWRATFAGAYRRKLTGVGEPRPSVHETAAIADAVLRQAVRESTGLVVSGWDSFPHEFARAAAARPDFLRYLPPFGTTPRYEAAVVLARLILARLPLAPSAATTIVSGLPVSLQLQATAAPLFFAIAGAPHLLASVSAALIESHIPRSSVEGSEGSAQALGDLLHRYWLHVT